MQIFCDLDLLLIGGQLHTDESFALHTVTNFKKI